MSPKKRTVFTEAVVWSAIVPPPIHRSFVIVSRCSVSINHRIGEHENNPRKIKSRKITNPVN